MATYDEIKANIHGRHPEISDTELIREAKNRYYSQDTQAENTSSESADDRAWKNLCILYNGPYSREFKKAWNNYLNQNGGNLWVFAHLAESLGNEHLSNGLYALEEIAQAFSAAEIKFPPATAALLYVGQKIEQYAAIINGEPEAHGLNQYFKKLAQSRANYIAEHQHALVIPDSVLQIPAALVAAGYLQILRDETIREKINEQVDDLPASSLISKLNQPYHVQTNIERFIYESLNSNSTAQHAAEFATRPIAKTIARNIAKTNSV